MHVAHAVEDTVNPGDYWVRKDFYSRQRRQAHFGYLSSEALSQQFYA
jgi:hypothetical protein